MQPLHRAPRSNSLLVAHFPLHASAADGCRSSGGLLPQAQHTRQHRQQHDAAGRPSVAVFKRRARGQRQQSIRALRVCQLQCAAMVISHVTKRFRWRYDACFEFVVRRKEGMKRNPSFVEQLKQCVLQPPPPPPLVLPRLKCSRRYESCCFGPRRRRRSMQSCARRRPCHRRRVPSSHHFLSHMCEFPGRKFRAALARCFATPQYFQSLHHHHDHCAHHSV